MVTAIDDHSRICLAVGRLDPHRSSPPTAAVRTGVPGGWVPTAWWACSGSRSASASTTPASAATSRSPASCSSSGSAANSARRWPGPVEGRSARSGHRSRERQNECQGSTEETSSIINRSWTPHTYAWTCGNNERNGEESRTALVERNAGGRVARDAPVTEGESEDEREHAVRLPHRLGREAAADELGYQEGPERSLDGQRCPSLSGSEA